MPILPLAREGKMDEAILEIVRANVREPVQVEGDLYSLTACNEIGCRRLVEMMDEFGLTDLSTLGAYMVEHSHQALIEHLHCRLSRFGDLLFEATSELVHRRNFESNQRKMTKRLQHSIQSLQNCMQLL